MGPKVQQDKLAWQWAETTDPDSITAEHREAAYRVKLKSCSRISGHRNCKGNPHCLIGLGERDWFEELEESTWHDVEDPEKERRQKGAFVGLKNLGATCYVNTFLQLWFHNLKFRDAIYKWRSLDDIFKVSSQEENKSDAASVESTKESKVSNGEPSAASNGIVISPEEEKDLQPDTVCGHMQLIFALLQFSNRRYIDPKPFIDIMGLDAAYQQDAQEFSKLFMSLLEGQLIQQSEPTVRNLVQELFKGEYNYVTECHKCENSSKRLSEFYELDLNIKGNTEIHQCIREFLKEEKLEGDNKYFCGHCNSKQNAGRRIELKKIPEVLNLQLLRFVFDRKTGQKKKLNTYIEFPEQIDLSCYLSQSDGTTLYDLKAVLIHRGPSAYSGHYIAHIKDSDSQNWHKFNDVTIEKIGGRNLQLGSEEDVESKGDKKPRTMKGFHASRNSYMLVYQKKTAAKEEIPVVKLSSLSNRIQKLVRLDQQRFEDYVTELKSMRDKNVEHGLVRQQTIKDVYGMMPVKEDMNWEWISTAWLRSWLEQSTDAKVPKINQSPVVCRHGRLNPDCVPQVKCITEGSAEILYTKYGGGPRLKGPESMCAECVRERCRIIRMKSRLSEDHKLITVLLKENKQIDDTCVDECYWIAKDSLKGWRKMAIRQIEKAEKSIEENVIEPTKASDSKGTFSCAPPHDSNSSATEDDMSFNDDVLCGEHNMLSTDETGRRLIPENIWSRLKVYFPRAPEFKFGSEICKQCKLKDAEDEQKLKLNKQMAIDQKSALQQLYFDRSRPVWKKDIPELNIVTKHFLLTWRAFIKDPSKHDPIQSVNNGSLLCRHGGLCFDACEIGTSDTTQQLEYIWPEEWITLGKYVNLDAEVKISRVEEDSGAVTWLSIPDPCVECRQEQKDAEQKSKTVYSSALVYVRRMTDKDIQIIRSQASGSQLSTGDSSLESANGDPDFIQKTATKRKSCEPSTQVEKMARVEFGGSRRSTRHRKVRGEKEIQVSSTQKLLDLKIEIMKQFSVAPMDQHIWVNGEELKGNDRLLGELGVTPGDVLMLKIDEAGDEALFLEDVARASQPEKGFQGTGLLGM